MEERIWVAGHRGMVGSAITRLLRTQGRNVITVDRTILDLRKQDEVEFWLRANQPTSIIFAAAKVGGIIANSTYPCGLHLRQPDDPNQRHPWRPQGGRRSTRIPWLLLHLS